MRDGEKGEDAVVVVGMGNEEEWRREGCSGKGWGIVRRGGGRGGCRGR